MPNLQSGNMNRFATVSGLLAFLCFILVPFMPVNQTQSSVQWPQNGTIESVNAPLISVAPESFEASIPLEAIDHLREGENLLLGTVPPDSPQAHDRGLFVTVTPEGGVDVAAIGDVVFQIDEEDIRPNAVLNLDIQDEQSRFTITGSNGDSETVEEDIRPQVTGLYTEIEPDAPLAGLSADVEINSRFTSTPTVVKQVLMWVGSLLALVALYSLARLDKPRPGNSTSFKPTALDGVIGAVLVFWHIFGANTSDDGFILSMARASEHSGYMANYYRWYGVPEAPFGSPYYDLLSLMTNVSTASIWMRLPALIAGFGIWFVLSRAILPRLGAAIAQHRIAYWTAGFMFLAFWLPYNNGIRPEPIIAFGALLTWALFERAFAQDRFLPAALATITAAFTLTVGPTGLLAVGVFLVSLPGLLQMLDTRTNKMAILMPFLGVGTAVMVPVFADQTLATVLESTRVRGLIGPSLNWYSEHVRYATLLDPSVDGSLTRRFAMITMLVSLGLVLYSLTRHKEVPGAALGPTYRLVAIILLSFFFLMFTPTKWTHHFGIYAGLAGAVAALGAVVLAQIAARSAHARTFTLAGVTFLMAITFAGWNGWWYVSSFGVPWWDKTPSIKGIEFTNLILLAALVLLVVGIVQAYRRPPTPITGRWQRVMTAPLAVASILIVTFSLLTFIKAFIDQAPAYSVGMGNVKALGGNSNYLADEALIETNTNDSFLTPVGDVPLGESLETDTVIGFEPSAVPDHIVSETQQAANVGAIADETTEDTTETDTTGGTRASGGVNGSTVQLPFNLDPMKVPVLGSYVETPTTAAQVTTGWYHLPESTAEDQPLLVVSVAGRIEHHDRDGILQSGETLRLEYGQLQENGKVKKVGDTRMIDIGPTPTWRNLRFPLEDIPENVDTVRLRAVDSSLNPDEWIAFTPPRVPSLTQLSELVSDDIPALLDWSVALQFPGLRTFDHYAGVTEIPEFRITPDAEGKSVLTSFMDFYGGGALSTAEAVNSTYEIPSYTRDDWQRDWGSIERYVRRTNSQGDAPTIATITYEEVRRSGLWHPSEMKIRESE